MQKKRKKIMNMVRGKIKYSEKLFLDQKRTKRKNIESYLRGPINPSTIKIKY